MQVFPVTFSKELNAPMPAVRHDEYVSVVRGHLNESIIWKIKFKEKLWFLFYKNVLQGLFFEYESH